MVDFDAIIDAKVDAYVPDLELPVPVNVKDLLSSYIKTKSPIGVLAHSQQVGEVVKGVDTLKKAPEALKQNVSEIKDILSQKPIQKGGKLSNADPTPGFIKVFRDHQMEDGNGGWIDIKGAVSGALKGEILPKAKAAIQAALEVNNKFPSLDSGRPAVQAAIEKVKAERAKLENPAEVVEESKQETADETASEIQESQEELDKNIEDYGWYDGPKPEYRTSDGPATSSVSVYHEEADMPIEVVEQSPATHDANVASGSNEEAHDLTPGEYSETVSMPVDTVSEADHDTFSTNVEAGSGEAEHGMTPGEYHEEVEAPVSSPEEVLEQQKDDKPWIMERVPPEKPGEKVEPYEPHQGPTNPNIGKNIPLYPERRSRWAIGVMLYSPISLWHDFIRAEDGKAKNRGSQYEDPSFLKLRRDGDLKQGSRLVGTEIEKILISGADFIPNHYTAAFYWQQSGQMQWNLKQSTDPIEQRFLNNTGLAVRMVSIQVPHIKNSTFQVQLASHAITKLKSAKDISKKASFTFRLDGQLAWLKLFGQLAGESNFYEGYSAIDRRKIAYVVANSMATSNIRAPHLMLAVQLRNLGPAYQSIDGYYRVALFEDVKIVGTDSLKYDSGGGIQEMSVEFIYKRMRVYRTGREANDRLQGGGYFGQHRSVVGWV